MDRVQLERRIAQKKQFMLDEKYLNATFLLLEELAGDRPRFIENVLVNFISKSTGYIEKIEEILETKPLNLSELERMIMKLKETGNSVGAGTFTKATEYMHLIFRNHRFDINRMASLLGLVKSQHTALKSQLEPYIEMLGDLRATYTDEDIESVGSNNMDD